MVVSIGAVASASQGVFYYEKDGYYARDDPAHREASSWSGKGEEKLGLEGPVDPDLFRSVLEGEAPDGSGRRLGRRGPDGVLHHRPGRDLTFSAPKSVSLAALVGGDGRVIDAHDLAVARTLAWVDGNVAETRMKDPETGKMVKKGEQKTVVATFRHDTSRNLDPLLHTHSVIANMVRGDDGKWRTMSNEKLYASKMLLGALYRSKLARDLEKLGYGIEKTHADGRFEIAGVPREVIEAFSTRRAEIEAAMAERGIPAENQRLAQQAALMTRARKRDVDKAELQGIWEKQAIALGFDARTLAAEAMARGKDASREGARTADVRQAREGLDWAIAHLSEREAVFSRTDLLAATLARDPGAVSVEAAERAVEDLTREGRLHAAPALEGGDGMTTDKALADERETIGLMRDGRDRGRAPMRSWMVSARLHKGPLTQGQREAVKLILSSKDRVVGVQGYAGTGKTTMLNRARALLEKRGYEVKGLAPSASAVKTLATEAGIESETLQRFLARNAGVAEGRLTKKGEREMRAAYRKTVLVVDEGSLASTVQARDLLRIANSLRLPRVVLVGDAKQLDAVDAGKPFAQLQQAGMKTATMDEILRQRDPDLKAAVQASLAGDMRKAFEKLGSNVAEVNPDNIAGAVAARWLRLSPEARENTGGDGPEPRSPAADQCPYQGASRPGGSDPRARDAEPKAGVAGLHPCREGPRGQLRPGRRGGFPPSLQAARGREGKGAARRRSGSRGPNSQARRQGRATGPLGARSARGSERRGRGLQGRKHGVAGGRPHPLDPEPRRSRTGQQTDRRGDKREERPCDLPSGGRAGARHEDGRSPAAPSRPRLGLDRACVPGADGGQRHRGHGGGPPATDHPEELLRGNQPGQGPSGARDGRRQGPTGATGNGDRGADRGPGSYRVGQGEDTGSRIGVDPQS